MRVCPPLSCARNVTRQHLVGLYVQPSLAGRASCGVTSVVVGVAERRSEEPAVGCEVDRAACPWAVRRARLASATSTHHAAVASVAVASIESRAWSSRRVR